MIIFAKKKKKREREVFRHLQPEVCVLNLKNLIYFIITYPNEPLLMHTIDFSLLEDPYIEAQLKVLHYVAAIVAAAVF